MLRCCEPFNADIADEVFINASAEIKFCPFCGKALRFDIIKAEDIEPYWVYDGTKTLGLFESREAAEEYVLLQRV